MKKLAVITGANRGLGRSLVQEFSASSWNVMAITRSPEVLKARAGSTDVVTVQQDVRSEPGPELAEALNGRPVDLLINNAVQGAPHAELGTIRAEGVLNAVDVNVAGPLRLVQFLLPNLLEAPDPIIINVSSRLGSLAAQANRDFSGLSTSYAYKISKAAQNMLTVSLAQDLHGRIPLLGSSPRQTGNSHGSN
ncbi:NAD(P)-dependent dehydrogenase (short-subunit alcohol dehydrogenase family) [Arthrobacter sp. V1I7]|uniref:SDR family NAD(P)-dependent oxidoreductase n=1 Tax=Arthrobacter sp. V1I7 TaxID=3042274 RepID=UPI002782DC02|nr:SDR family NAD(P)-dependent oxidoreductase [Arthrobacter sp. V1I7]MDQ0823692.1 NAD(P)-dependent dehydrogenase (short-subunit alcohol dehydrogenase family) [Arthrobacter sp. V1I7]